MLSAATLHRRGLDEANAGRHAAARRSFRTALDRATDDETVAQIELSLAYTESELGTVDTGLALCQHALGLAEVPDLVRGKIWGQLGLLHMRAGDGDAALAALARAEPLLDDDQAEALGNLHLTRGNIHLQRRQVAEARHDFEAAARHYARGGFEVHQGKTQHNLGYTQLLSGDLPDALRLMDEASPVLKGLSKVSEAVGAQDRSEALIAAGQPEDAAEALRTSSRAFASRGMRQRQAEALLVLAQLLLRDEPREAKAVASRAARLFSARGSEVWALRARGVAFTADILAGRHDAALLPQVTEVADALRWHGLRQEAGALTLQSARIALARHEPALARTVISTVRVGPTSPLEHRLLGREVRAELAAAQGRRVHALGHVRQGLRELLDWQASFGSLDLQTSLVRHGQRLAFHGLSLALEDGRPTTVFEWAERARALASQVAPMRPPADPETAELLIELRELHAAIRAAEKSGATAAPERRRAAALRATIRQRAWHGAGSGVVTEPVDLMRVMAELEPLGGVLIAHVFVAEHLHALVAGAGPPRLVDLGDFGPVRRLLEGMQADLDMAATHLPGPMRQVVTRSLHARLAELDQHLTGSLGPIGDGPVVLVPAGALAGTPWSMLPSLRGRPVTVPRSASLWLDLHRVASPPRRAGFVAGPRVRRAEEEIRRASGAWRHQRTLVGPDADAASVSALAADVDVLHVAAHGRHAADNPLFSGLELADGPWFGYDIDRLASIPSTVVLSACEVGRSSMRWGEEAVGMTAAWLHAGARVVIASPASVDDDVASEVLGGIHQGLSAGRPPAEALAAVTAGLADEAPCPFICFGAGW
ncbi:CHAT domain-containing protein [Segeticoccus rhizosphaerae]|uniref:CHAT domain-containing protein n=1 Tax=Segeticoccus rhizosphaerae TaxID=1104777 RepID=UPI0010C0FA60|nr:CHAT domain-containing protein [Ornithinicoccus soli]